mmetsp:Transcript_1773/g.4512  ORF Transcript_1773/g.4512 Transcript_1773/m.4512 type:complete len:225 (+) Transcript_1773:125-799(+)
MSPPGAARRPSCGGPARSGGRPASWASKPSSLAPDDASSTGPPALHAEVPPTAADVTAEETAASAECSLDKSACRTSAAILSVVSSAKAFNLDSKLAPNWCNSAMKTSCCCNPSCPGPGLSAKSRGGSCQKVGSHCGGGGAWPMCGTPLSRGEHMPRSSSTLFWGGSKLTLFLAVLAGNSSSCSSLASWVLVSALQKFDGVVVFSEADIMTRGPVRAIVLRLLA